MLKINILLVLSEGDGRKTLSGRFFRNLPHDNCQFSIFSSIDQILDGFFEIYKKNLIMLKNSPGKRAGGDFSLSFLSF